MEYAPKDEQLCKVKETETKLFEEQIQMEREIITFVMDFYDLSEGLEPNLKFIECDKTQSLIKKIKPFKYLYHDRYPQLLIDIKDGKKKKCTKQLLKKQFQFHDGIVITNNFWELGENSIKTDWIFRDLIRNISRVKNIAISNLVISNHKFMSILLASSPLESISFNFCEILSTKETKTLNTKSKISKITIICCAKKCKIAPINPSGFLPALLDTISQCIDPSCLASLIVRKPRLTPQEHQSFLKDHPEFHHVYFKL
ncbi:unnamed protein product [Moneuplotes crassus]|uniref:Uncharacterized protein n=1 Tax=Euplotes crassus TaxID=5936 RepID=A0AAD1XU82_EUPCR|nr:unnamed protein product [Moneuplotes crassus]